MPYILLFGLLLVLAIIFLRKLSEANPKMLAYVLKRTLFFILTFTAIYLIIAGRMAYAVVVLLTLAISFGPSFLKRFQNLHLKGNLLRSKMTKDEARKILDVDSSTDQEGIEKAYRKLITRNHPDHGGSSYIATQLNQARDTLLKEE